MPDPADLIDLAKVDPCAGGCGRSVRRFASVPVAGTTLDPVTSGPWWCDHCLADRTAAAADEVRGRG